MAEIALDDDTLQTPGRPPAPARLPITDISQWVERYSLMTAVLTTRFPAKAPELLAYQATIVRAERNYEGKRWVSYDRQFRREALARKDLNWSVSNARLYNEAFTGRARAIARCSYCLQDDHTATYCPKNPHRPPFGWFPDPSTWQPQATPLASQPPSQPARHTSQEVCRRFNDGRCRQARCRYRHACSSCHAPTPSQNSRRGRSAMQGHGPDHPSDGSLRGRQYPPCLPGTDTTPRREVDQLLTVYH